MATVLVDIATKIHIKLGPGLFESVYEEYSALNCVKGISAISGNIRLAYFISNIGLKRLLPVIFL
jgi:hypothetical protein